MRRFFHLLAVAALGAGLAWAADAKATVAAASKALGAEGLKTLEFTGSGFDYVLGQSANPSLPWPKFTDKSYTRVVNFDNWSTRMQRIRLQAENPPRGGGQQPIIGEQSQNQTAQGGAAADELALTLPQAFLRSAATASDLSAADVRQGGKTYTALSFTASNKAKMTGWVNAQNQVERVETKIDNPVYGDMVFEAAFSEYKALGGIQFPTRIVQKQGGYPVLDLTVSDVKVNVPAPAIPAAGPGGPPAAAAASEKLGDGVWLVTGGYAAVVVDFKDHILVIEGGQNDARSQAVIAEAKRLVPGKPITELVNTHSHVDHAGGVRAYVAEGATIITHEINKPFYERTWKVPHTLTPDRLAQSPKAPKFKTVKERLTLTDGNHVVELYHQTGLLHHDGMLLVYLPKEKVLIEADGYNPPAAPPTQTPATISPYNVNLLESIDRLKLNVDRIVPIHLPGDNRKIGLAELRKVTGKE